MANHPLQSSGAISMRDINLEFNRSASLTISLNNAVNGVYGAFNPHGSTTPTSGGKSGLKLSHWYGYNHNAPDIVPPTTPTLSVNNITTDGCTLTWTASTDLSGIGGYDVFKGVLLHQTVAGNVTSLIVTGLAPSTAYSFYVQADDNSGNTSTASNTVNITTATPADTSAPTTPSNLTASNVGSTTLTLTWTAATDNVGVTNYLLYRGGVLWQTLSNVLTYNAVGLSASTAYSFYVKAKDAAGNIGSQSNTVNVTTTAAPDTTAPTAPTSCTATKATYNINIAWSGATDNVGVTKYNLYRNNVIYIYDITPTSYSDVNLTDGSYYYSVVAKDAAGNVSPKSPNSSTIIIAGSPY